LARSPSRLSPSACSRARPHDPGIALGSEVLLYGERAAAFFALTVAVLSVLAQAVRGRLPTQLTTSGLGYEAEAAAADAVSGLQDQVRELERALAALSDVVLGGNHTPV
jgi:hypothetical protein